MDQLAGLFFRCVSIFRQNILKGCASGTENKNGLTSPYIPRNFTVKIEKKTSPVGACLQS